MNGLHPQPAPCCLPEEHHLLHQSGETQPDVIFDASNMASNIKNATVQTIHEANRIVCKLKSKKVTLNFQHLGKDIALKMIVFSDTSFGNLSEGGTQGGHLILLMGKNWKFSPLTWQSKRVKRIVRSRFAGETLALSDGMDNAVFPATLFSELITGDTEHAPPIICITDNHSLMDALQSTKSVSEKRLRLEISSIKELVQAQKIERVLWHNTNKQLADCLTKKEEPAYQLLNALNDGQWKLD
uniref:uncharacterized protein LOC109975033 n=1 Tax=Monopterus albus TaxID=43700 RepID=UPI0009B2EEA3|nr:uncharacterized protein LOC109975033 [Monopterus albus]